MVVLVAVSVGALDLVLPISIAIAAVLAIVVVSYTQTVRAYETSGGAYIVAKENLGTLPSLVAGAALLVDYVLTVAVSVTAGVLALTSAAPSLEPHKVGLSLAFVVLLTVVNLRGVRESGVLFAIPTYGFVAVMFVMIGTGVGQCLDGACPQADVPNPLAAGTAVVGVLVILQAFASGSAALTGVEAISNGVGAFRRPKGRNAARHARRNGRDRHLALPRRLVSRRVDERGAERECLGDLGDRAWDLPGIVVGLVRLLRRPGAHVRDPHPRGEHLVPGLPAPRSGSRARPVLSSPVREPRRPTRLLERDRGSRGHRRVADLGVQRGRHRPDPPIRHRRVHGVHDLAGRDGPALAQTRAAGLAVARGRQRRGRSRDRPRRDCRRRVEVHPGRVGGDRRDPDPDRVLLRRATPLQQGRAPPPRRRRLPSPRRRRRRTASSSTSSPSTRLSKRLSGTRARSQATTSARSTSLDHAPIRGSFRASASSRACSPTSTSSLQRTAGSTR